MWDNLKHSGSLKNSYIQTLESQIHLVKPKLVFLRNKYHIHYVFGSSAESELYNLYLARTVPFNTTAGSYQIDIEPTMKLQNVANMHSYIRPHDLLSSCEQFENTFYCTSASIEKDSIDQCIQAAKTRNLPMLFKHCHVYPVHPIKEIIRLSPGMVYYDMKAKVGHTCGGVNEQIQVEGQGIFNINPGCTARFDHYKFENNDGRNSFAKRVENLYSL